MVFQGSTLAQMLADDIRDMAGLVLLIDGGIVVDFLAVAALGPQGLALAAHVVLNDAVGSIQNISGGAIVLLQSNCLGTGKDLLEV